MTNLHVCMLNLPKRPVVNAGASPGI